jgi:heavy metal sensor kinase
VAILFVLLTTVSVFVPLRLAGELLNQCDQSLLDRSAQLARQYALADDGEFIENGEAAVSGLPGGQSWAQLLTPAGQLVKTTGDGLDGRSALTPAMVDAVSAAGTGQAILLTTRLGPDRQRFRLVVRPVGRSRVLVLATSTDLIDDVVARLTALVVIAGTLAVLLAATSGWWLARLALLPITRISRQAERIRVDHLDERIPVGNPADEVGHLAGTLNTMFDRLRDGVREQRRLVADTSHELRTPLAIMRAELDAALGLLELPEPVAEALERNGAEVDRMSRIVDNLLTLARIDQGGLELLRRPVDLAEEAATVASRFRELAATKRIRLQVRGAQQRVSVDRERIDQVLGNLIDNAVKYTSTGQVDLWVWRRAGEVGVTVTDTGCGIPAGETERVFDRFYRVDAARSRSAGGSGLGLAISQEIIRAHHGRLWLRSTPGLGSEFSFAVPE